MLIGIKYCGGCNPVYDRGRRVEKFKRDNPDHTYVTYPSEKTADHWLVVHGCSRACADTSDLIARRRLWMLWKESDFQRAQEEIRASSAASHDGKLRLIAVGDRAQMTRTITRADVQKFGEATGDANLIHSDGDAARASGFADTPVHGMFLNSLVSSLMGSELPGSGTVFASHETRFIRPVFPGDTITISLELTDIEDRGESFAGTLRATIKDQNGDRVLTSSCVQMMRKTLFGIRNGEVQQA